MLETCEIFKSIQGESTRAGKICSFVRLAKCNLRCRWCDSNYAFTEGTRRSADDIIAEVNTHKTTLVEITGGEPLLQAETPLLCGKFQNLGYTVLIETNGTCDISAVLPPAIRIVDIKCPSSGHAGSFLEKNFSLLSPTDECKFVMTDRNDFHWALEVVRSRSLNEIVTVLFSPVIGTLAPAMLAEWIINENAPVRLGLQLHKIIWGDKRGA
ncbi:MAG: radical SAM protein [Chitinispirillaceae bacterium]|jgi:7-carboxy-7-deazaguanine synthase|nr:radical SAM protein [Chitinispirillaceae bacterium]